MGSEALNRITSRSVEEPLLEVDTDFDPFEEDMLAPPEGVAKEAALGNTGALQGPLQVDESKGGAMSSPGVRPAAQPAVKVKKTPIAVKQVSPPQQTSKEAYVSPRPASILRRRQTGMIVMKDKRGRRLLAMITTNSYRDREKEAIATKALQGYVRKAWGRVEDKCLPDNTLRFWHNGDIGDIVYADMQGPFLIEVAKERPNKTINLARPGQKAFMVSVKEVWDYVEENPDGLEWGASHGFKFFKGQRKDGVYQNIYKFESSVLPLKWAANPYTFSGVIDMEPREKLLQQLVGRANAKALRQGAHQLKKALDARGITHKEVKEKGLLEDLGEKIGAVMGELTDDPDKAQQLQADVMSAIAEALSAGAGGDEAALTGTEADAAQGYQYDELDDTEAPVMDEEDKEDDESEDGVMSSKGLKLLDVLIQSQETIADSIEQVADRQKSLEKLSDLPDSFSKLDRRLKALETQLKMRPRAASESDDTIVEDDDLLARVKKAMSNFDPFFGVHVEGE